MLDIKTFFSPKKKHLIYTKFRQIFAEISHFFVQKNSFSREKSSEKYGNFRSFKFSEIEFSKTIGKNPDESIANTFNSNEKKTSSCQQINQKNQKKFFFQRSKTSQWSTDCSIRFAAQGCQKQSPNRWNNRVSCEKALQTVWMKPDNTITIFLKKKKITFLCVQVHPLEWHDDKLFSKGRMSKGGMEETEFSNKKWKSCMNHFSFRTTQCW